MWTELIFELRTMDRYRLAPKGVGGGYLIDFVPDQLISLVNFE